MTATNVHRLPVHFKGSAAMSVAGGSPIMMAQTRARWLEATEGRFGLTGTKADAIAARISALNMIIAKTPPKTVEEAATKIRLLVRNVTDCEHPVYRTCLEQVEKYLERLARH